MIEHLPIYISILFAFTAVATLALFYWVLKNSTSQTTKESAIKIIIALFLWLGVQAVLTLKHVFNSDTQSFPPRIFVLGILPPMLIIVILFATKKGRQFLNSLPLINLTYLNVVRIPVEIVLFLLFLHGAVPELMTFEGRNPDILAGITAPLIAYFGCTRKKISSSIALIWHLVCLALLMNIVVHAFLSAPSPLQKLAFDQPNIGILYFPFSWLPTFVVPVVLLGHLASIQQLIKRSLDKAM